MFTSLRAKLIAVLLLVCTSMMVMFVMILRTSHETYHQELRQEINRRLASNLANENEALVSSIDGTNGAQTALARFARINPDIVVHLLDREGRILASSSSADNLKLRQVSVAPLERFIAGNDRFPILGDDPLDPARKKVFSAAAVPTTGSPAGYLYVVLRDEDHEGAAESLRASYALQQGIWLIVCWSALALLAALLLVKFITRPLQQLTDAVERFHGESFSDESKLPAALPASSRDEIGRLTVTFNEMAARIVNQMRELKRSDATRRELFENISHDLRTPLSSLLGYLETISMRQQLSEAERHKYCEIATQEARHLTVLVDNLLELAKLDAPEATISREPFMLHELVGAITGKFALAASRKSVTLTWQSAQPVPVVNADPALIERALENLVDNALRHTPAGGTVSINLTPQTKGVTVRVSDTGSGIPPEDLQRIFDRFYRGEKNRQAVSNSAGLGLAICKRILELHDSSISVESEVGVGTCFAFALPLADRGQAPNLPADNSAHEAGAFSISMNRSV